MFEALLAPIAFTLIMVVLIGWALVRRARRRGAGPSDARIRGKEGESPSTDDAQRRRRYGS